MAFETCDSIVRHDLPRDTPSIWRANRRDALLLSTRLSSYLDRQSIGTLDEDVLQRPFPWRQLNHVDLEPARSDGGCRQRIKTVHRNDPGRKRAPPANGAPAGFEQPATDCLEDKLLCPLGCRGPPLLLAPAKSVTNRHLFATGWRDDRKVK